MRIIELEPGCILFVYFTTWRSQDTIWSIELEPGCILPIYFTTWRSQDTMRIELEPGCMLLVYFTTWRSQETMRRIELNLNVFFLYILLPGEARKP